MLRSRFFLMSALAVAALAFSACSAPAAEFQHMTVSQISYEIPPADVVATPVAYVFARRAEDFNRMPVSALAPGVGATFALYRTITPVTTRRRALAVPWRA